MIGSLGGGGRYDGLIGMFSGEEIPACGFSLGLERILVVMAERNMFPADGRSARPPTCWSRIFDEAADRGRRCGWRAELRAGGPARGGLSRTGQARASSSSTPRRAARAFVAVVGGDERASGEVTIKDMKTGEQQTVAARRRRRHAGSRARQPTPIADRGSARRGLDTPR